MKKVAGSLKLLYSQYRELQAFSQFGSDLDKDTKARLDQGERIVAILKQDQNAPVTVEHQVLIILAATNNFLAEIPVSEIGRWQKELIQYIDERHPEIVSSIRETKQLTDDNRKAIEEALNDFNKKFLKEL